MENYLANARRVIVSEKMKLVVEDGDGIHCTTDWRRQ